jgi:hypothetical protein
MDMIRGEWACKAYYSNAGSCFAKTGHGVDPKRTILEIQRHKSKMHDEKAGTKKEIIYVD